MPATGDIVRDSLSPPGLAGPVREADGKLRKSNHTVGKAAENTTLGSEARPMGGREPALRQPIFKRSRRHLDGPQYRSGQGKALAGWGGLGYPQRTLPWSPDCK